MLSKTSCSTIALSIGAMLCTLVHADAATTPWASRSFGHVWVLCDAGLVCHAYRAEGDEEGRGAYLEVMRSPSADAAPKVFVGLAHERGGPIPRAPATLTMHIGGRDAPAITLRRTREQRAARYEATGDGLVLARRLADAPSIVLMNGNARVFELTLEGSSAAFRFIDDKQRRVDTTTAIVARGTRAPTTLGPIAVPVVRRAPAVSQAGLSRAIPRALAALPAARTCLAEAPDGEAPFVARLSSGVVLYGLPCGSGAYNVLWKLFLVDARGNASAVVLPFHPEEIVVDAEYDPATRTLSEWDRGRGLGDYGSESTWVWNGRAFEMVRRRTMGACCMFPDTWPMAYVAQVRD